MNRIENIDDIINKFSISNLFAIFSSFSVVCVYNLGLSVREKGVNKKFIALDPLFGAAHKRQ